MVMLHAGGSRERVRRSTPSHSLAHTHTHSSPDAPPHWSIIYDLSHGAAAAGAEPPATARRSLALKALTILLAPLARLASGSHVS